MEPSNLQKIVIVDFGSQFTQLVARKIRELGSYSEIINFKNIFKLKNDSSVKGIILSGGPLSITDNKGISLDSFLIKKKNTNSRYMLWSSNSCKKVWRKDKSFKTPRIW